MEVPAASTMEDQRERVGRDITFPLGEVPHVSQTHSGEPRSAIYRPLDSSERQIRLLELLSGEHSAALRANLSVISLDARHKSAYETISYVWGPPVKSAAIDIAGVRLPIPEATAAVLRRVRQSDRGRLLWIDAVCINQDDINERSDQVGLMRYIYSGSTQNLIHLTDDEDMGIRITRLADDITREIRDKTDNYANWRSMVYTRYGTNRSTQGPYRSDIDIESLEFLTVLPWFRRLWVLQETRLAPSNVCYLGSKCYPLNSLLRTVIWLEYISNLPAHDTLMSRSRGCMLNMFNLADREHGWYNYDETPPLLDILSVSRVFEKSEPRDGVYAVLGIVAQSTGIVPDYRKCVETINKETTRHLLRSNNDLWALRGVSHSIDGPRGCSWACRYDLGLDAHLDPDGIDPLDFRAHVEHEVPSLLEPEGSDPNTISLEGIQTDSVSVASTVCMTSNYVEYDAMRPWLLSAAQTLGLPHAAEPEKAVASTADELKSLACAVMAECADSGEKAADADIMVGVEWLRAVSDHDLSKSDPDMYRRIYDVAASRVDDHCQLIMLKNRRLFRTHTGKFGLGPKVMRPGDVITAVRGSDLPVVLRRRQEEYQFIGFAYVHGLMYGETAIDLLAAGVKEQVFVVR
ncbi:Ubiquitin-like protein [Oleoguttula sp. CCFEE 5521]